MRQRQRVAACLCIEMARGPQPGGAGLAVPAFELGQQARQVRIGVGIGNALGKVVAGHGLAIEALEVQLHAASEPGARAGGTAIARQGLHHAHQFGTLFVNRDGVEIIDFDVAVRPHRVRHRAGVLRKLGGAKHAHVFNALDGAG